ncbi:hypothetical protein QUF63_09055 [Anaerolineales bacterium HSG25]|nr:hypothetical protein [Anaerolineales bacterium HSG25]
MNPKVMEAWFTIMAETAKGTTQSQELFKLFPQATAKSDEFNEWITRFMSPGAMTHPNDFGAGYEEWCRMMGLVPRSRYLELLERYEIVRNRLEEAEEKIRSLQSLLGVKGQEEEAKKVLDLWGTTLEKTLQAQADWMKAWGTTEKETTKDSTDTENPTTDSDL